MLSAAGLVLAAGLFGCASPGPPRAPSLQLPAQVGDLTATRRGADVALQFTLPQRATDGSPLRSTTLTAIVCRAVEQAACVPIATLPPQTFAARTEGHATVAKLRDALDTTLATGTLRMLTYRVELRNDAGRSGSYSDATYAAAGAAPAPVEGLQAEGSRLGIVISWKPTADEDADIVLRREDVGAKPAATPKVAVPAAAQHHSGFPDAAHVAGGDDPHVVWLRTSTQEVDGPSAPQSAATPAQQNITLDTTAAVDEPYLYSAERRRSVHLGDRTLELRSAASTQVSYTLHAIYPPPAPTDLGVASFAPQNGTAATVLVDLVWQPVDDPNLVGYNVYRQVVDAAGRAAAKQRLNTGPVQMPAFHDKLDPAQLPRRYQYSVTALNKQGIESAPCAITLEVEKP